MFKKILIALVVVIAAILVFAATKPDTFKVERTASIKAAPPKIFPLINNMHNWASWSPYEKLDPAMKKTFTGPDSGVGAVYAWEGNSKAGAGSMEITDAPAPSKVTMKLDFVKPFVGHNIAEFTLTPDGVEGTTVTWSMSGPSPYMMKVMGIFCNMDKLIGKDFETGLANLRALSEK